MQWLIAQIALAQTPHDVLDELAYGEGIAVQRVFDRSFDLPQLGDDGRTALLALSQFVPSASRDALRAVAGFGTDMRRMNRALKPLAALCLMGTTVDDRLVLHGLTRTLANARRSREKCERELHSRFVEHFRNFAEAHSQTTFQDFEALEAEKDNVLGALGLAAEGGNWDSVMRIRRALEEFLDLRGYWPEAISSGTQAEEAARESQNECVAEMFSVNTAIIYVHRGNYQHARQIFHQALEYFERTGSMANAARILHNLGVVAYERSLLREAGQFYARSLEIKQKLGDQNGIANTLYQKGMIAEDREDLIEAQRCYAESLKMKKRLGEQSSLAVILHNLAVIARYQQDFSKVRELYLESLKINKNLGDTVGVAITLHMLGVNEEDHGYLDQARKRYEESLEISRRLGFLLGMALTLHDLADIAQIQGDATKASQYDEESQRVRRELAQQRSLTSALLNGPTPTRKGRQTTDERDYGGSELGNRRGVAATLYSLRLIASDPGYQVEAARILRESLYIFEKVS
jgi:tetratricopeptide (TPR) repeat protein